MKRQRLDRNWLNPSVLLHVCLIAMLVGTALSSFSSCDKCVSGSQSLNTNIFPSEMTFVVGLTPQALSQTSLYKRFGSKISSNPQFTTFVQQCGIDPVSDLKAFSMAGQDAKKFDNWYFMFTGDFSSDKVSVCMEKMGGTKPKAAGKLVEYDFQGQKTFAYWMSANSVVVSRNQTGLEKVANKQTNLTRNAKMKELLSKTNTSSNLWAFGIVPGDLSAMASMGGAKPPQAGYLSVNYKSDLDLKLGLRFANESIAKQQAEMLNTQTKSMGAVPGLAELFKNVTYKTVGKDVVSKIDLNANQITQLTTMFATMANLGG